MARKGEGLDGPSITGDKGIIHLKAASKRTAALPHSPNKKPRFRGVFYCSKAKPQA
ncbi:hypothetical protein EDC28_103179 [Gallaecimonas pentaromativorans]|uniref:Uncharacterized protein n=1 Tax=Gallaecimonas pentaromativorans TaxID=584787 RepID=A0A3N1PVK6_9GAMM|nr:hypothetical protein EDC28_103179 [Gallaecimonas pentaromativorans]